MKDELTPGLGYVVDANGKSQATTIRDFRIKRNYEGKWCSLHNNSDIHGGKLSMKQQAIDHDLTVTDYRIRDWLIEDIGHLDTFVDIPQHHMAKELRLNKSNVSKSIKHLVELEILQRDDFLKKYRFNKAYLFAGSLDEAMTVKRRYKNKVKAEQAKPKWLN